MKKKIYLSLFVTLFSGGLVAQKGDRIIGVFATGKDFRESKLSYIIDCNSNNNKIRLNDFFCQPYLTIKQNGNKLKILKASLYGYQTCNKKIYRFNNKKELLLLNQGQQILIYKQLNTKVREGARINITNKYFSTDSNNSLQKLTIKNIKAAFPDNTKFHRLIDNYFKYNTDLGSFDNVTKMYKINWLLQESKKL